MTGSARIDFWNNKFISKIFKNEINDIRKKYEDFILIPTSFGITSKMEKTRRIKQLKYLKYLKNKKEIIEKKIEFNDLYKNFNEFCDLIEFIAKKKPNQKIVIRPHFAENKNDWNRRFKNLKNIIVINEGDISQWISAAGCIIHNGSTTGIQSNIMNKKVLIYSTKSSKKRENIFPNKFGKICLNKLEILKNLEIKIKKKNNLNLLSKRISVNNHFASKRIVNSFKTIKIKKSNKYKFIRPSLLNLFFIKNKFKFLKNNRSLSKSYVRNYTDKIPNGIKINEVAEFLDKLERYFNLQKLIKIRYCGPNCFLIYSKNS